MFYCHTNLVTTALHWACFFIEEEERGMGLTKRERYNCYNYVPSEHPMQEYIMCDLPKQN